MYSIIIRDIVLCQAGCLEEIGIFTIRPPIACTYNTIIKYYFVFIFSVSKIHFLPYIFVKIKRVIEEYNQN